MPYISRLACRFVLVTFSVFFSALPPLRPFTEARAQSSWQADWERILAAAKREGRVSIAGAPGTTLRAALVAGFEKGYPEIAVEYTGMSGRDVVPRIARERQAGIYQWDVFIGGPTSALAGLKPIGAFDPLRPALIRPEALDENKWLGGFQDGFMDSEGRLFYAFDGTVTQTFHVNWDVLSRGSIKSLKEVLDSKWAGKIVWEDPRQEGAGVNAGLVVSLTYGEEFFVRLLREQKIAYTRDRRQMTEWVVRGRYPIAIALATDELIVFQEKGVGRNVGPLDTELVGTMIPGWGAVGLMNRAPHPNAARIYLNWLLSSDGQKGWAQISQRNSRRVDVAPGDATRVPKPGIKYIKAQSEAMLPQRERIMQLAREHIRE